MVKPSVRKSVPKPIEKFRCAEWFIIIILKSDRWQRRLVAIILNHATTSGCLFLLDSGQIPFVSSPSVHQWLYQYFPGLSILGFHVTSQHMQIRRPPYWCRRSLLAYVKMQCFGAWFFKICRFRQNFWKHQKGRKKEDIRNILLSDYVKRLESHVKQRYLEKISLVRINPATFDRRRVRSTMFTTHRSNRSSVLFGYQYELLYKETVQSFQKLGGLQPDGFVWLIRHASAKMRKLII